MVDKRKLFYSQQKEGQALNNYKEVKSFKQTSNARKQENLQKLNYDEDQFFEEKFQEFLENCQGQILEEDLSNIQLEANKSGQFSPLLVNQKLQFSDEDEVSIKTNEENKSLSFFQESDYEKNGFSCQFQNVQSLKDLDLGLHLKQIDMQSKDQSTKIGVDTPQFTCNKSKIENNQKQVPYFIGSSKVKDIKCQAFNSDQIIEEEEIKYLIKNKTLRADNSQVLNKLRNFGMHKSNSANSCLNIQAVNQSASRQESSKNDNTKKRFGEDKLQELKSQISKLKMQNNKYELDLKRKLAEKEHNVEETKSRVRRLKAQITDYDSQFLQQRKIYQSTKQTVKHINSDLRIINQLFDNCDGQEYPVPSCIKDKQVRNLHSNILKLRYEDRNTTEMQKNIMNLKNQIQTLKQQQYSQANSHLEMILQLNNRIQQKETVIQSLKNQKQKLKDAQQIEEIVLIQAKSDNLLSSRYQNDLKIKTSNSISPQKTQDNKNIADEIQKSRQASPFSTLIEYESTKYKPRSQFLRDLEEKSQNLNQALSNLMPSTRRKANPPIIQHQKSLEKLNPCSTKSKVPLLSEISNIQEVNKLNVQKNEDLKRKRNSSTEGLFNLEYRLNKIDALLESSRNKFSKTSSLNKQKLLGTRF